jgi:hypothetical protein
VVVSAGSELVFVLEASCCSLFSFSFSNKTPPLLLLTLCGLVSDLDEHLFGLLRLCKGGLKEEIGN